jgi:hypothetical protein
LTSYLNVSLSEDGTDTIIQVSTSGAFLGADGSIDPATVDQTITLEGVAIENNEAATAIEQMLATGKLLVTD